MCLSFIKGKIIEVSLLYLALDNTQDINSFFSFEENSLNTFHSLWIASFTILYTYSKFPLPVSAERDIILSVIGFHVPNIICPIRLLFFFAGNQELSFLIIFSYAFVLVSSNKYLSVFFLLFLFNISFI